MPPQVGKAGESTRPVTIQESDGVEQTKSSGPEKKPAESKKETSGTAPTETYRATPKEASNKKAELAAGSVQRKQTLNDQIVTNLANERAKISRHYARVGRGDELPFTPGPVKTGADPISDTEAKSKQSESVKTTTPSMPQQHKSAKELARESRG